MVVRSGAAGATSGGGKRKQAEKLIRIGAEKSDGSVKLSCRQYVDRTCNDASFSRLALLISNVVLVAIVISTVSFVIGTEPSYEGAVWLDQLELVVVAIFTVEYTTRILVTAESRCAFALTPLNLIDLMAILPWYVEQLAGASNGEVLRVLRVLRVVRVFRVFKLARYADSMTVFAECMGRSTNALKMLTFFFTLAVLISSSLLFYAERGVRVEVADVNGGTDVVYLRSDGSESPFTSIASTFWWAVVTMTTVGYGDTFPVETSGKLIGTVAMLGGVLVLALPLSVIGQNFTESYVDSQKVKAYRTLAEELPEGCDPEVFILAASELEEHSEKIGELCGAISNMMQSKSTDVHVRALRKQLELQLASVQHACNGLTETVSDPALLKVMLANEGAAANIAKARTMLEQITAVGASRSKIVGAVTAHVTAQI